MIAAAIDTYEALPYTPTPDRFGVVSRVLREIANFETLFTDYQRACTPVCENVAACPNCRSRLELIAWRLTSPGARVWEVWKNHEDLVGILYLTDIIEGGDAKAHYVFWDKNLIGKTRLIEQMIEWCFTNHADWTALRRLTIEVPDFAFAMARHASKHLGFGGRFRYQIPERGRQFIPVEGVKQGVVPWKGTMRDMLILGRIRED